MTGTRATWGCVAKFGTKWRSRISGMTYINNHNDLGMQPWMQDNFKSLTDTNVLVELHSFGRRFAMLAHITKVLIWTVRAFSSASADAACKQFIIYNKNYTSLKLTSLMRSTYIDDSSHHPFQDLLWILLCHGGNNLSELSQTRASTRFSNNRMRSISCNKLSTMIQRS